MNLNEYQQRAQRTARKDHPMRLAVAALGLVGEAGECSELVKKHVGHGHGLDSVKLCAELGDVLWYVAELASAAGLTLDEVAEANINKLRERYPEGFSEARSINRGVAR